MTNLVVVNFIKIIPEKNKLQDETMAELKLNLTNFTKLLQSNLNFIGNNFNDFEKAINSTEIEELREDDISLNERAEASLKAFDIFSKNLQLEYKNFIDNYVKLQYKYFRM